MFNRVQTVGSVSEFLSGSYKYKKVERKINKRMVKTGIKVAVTVVAGSLLLDVSLPMALVNAATQPEVIPVNAVMDKATDFAADNLTITVAKALQPLIDILKELAQPIAGLMVTWGCLRFMIGQKEPGISNIQQAAIGYILVQLSPIILNLITGVGDSIT